MMGSVPSRLDHLSPCFVLYNSISILKGEMLNLLWEGSICAKRGEAVKSYVLPVCPIGKETSTYDGLANIKYTLENSDIPVLHRY